MLSFHVRILEITMDSGILNRVLGGSSLCEHTPAHATSELQRTSQSLPEITPFDDLQALLQPVTMELLEHDAEGELPLTVVVDDTVAFRSTKVRTGFYFGLVQSIHLEKRHSS
jgi:hypothetical protein